MALIVQKYGGTSVADVSRIKQVATRIKERYDQGNQIAVVVSARAGVTNELIAKAKEINPHPNEREMDMLLSAGEQETIALTAIALESLGVPAVSKTGAQAGILTDFAHTRARIVAMEGQSVKNDLSQGRVVIVAGFQGISKCGNITTLGRGGSDLSAIALASALNADLCEIYTDVDGVYTADPRIAPNARKINTLSYEEMLELASLGANVMQSRSVEFAQKFNVTFEVRSSFNKERGTIVNNETKSMEDEIVRGVVVDKKQSLITINEIPAQTGSVAKIFRELAKAGISVDMIVQNPAINNNLRLTFTVGNEDERTASSISQSIIRDMGSPAPVESLPIAILSIVGVGMRSHAGVASKLFDVMEDSQINLLAITTSEIRVSCAIPLESADVAVQATHDAFISPQG